MAYAVLASLITTTDKILNPYPLIIPCERQTIQSLHENIDSLISFLENTPPHQYQTTKSLEANIRDVGYKAEDILESYISKHSRSIYKLNEDDEAVETEDDDDENGEDDKNVIMLSQSLVEIMKGFESLMEEMKEIQSNVSFFGGVPVEQMTSLSLADGSSRLAFSPNSSGKNKFVLLDVDIMDQIKEQLFFGEKQLKVIPITGMGGIGKTTLAKNLIADPFTSSHFDVRGWVTISQQYSIKDVVENLLKDITGDKDLKNETLSECKVQLHKTLFNRRYVVVLDDLWDTEACDELLNLFPECNNGSRIMVTTRQSGVATFAAKSYHQMKLLNGVTSWDLLNQEVFPQEGNMNCPSELMEIGKEIAMKCKGLPLTISVVGGLLSKGEMTQEYWEHIAENMKSVRTEEGDHCSEILSLSYNHLPHHLKACFLYLGVYSEDFDIVVSELLQLWVVEGFLKPGPTDMEKVAEENLKDLIQRNLILVEKVGRSGRPKSCKIHDLLRDLCIREARREKFVYVWNKHTGFNREETKVHRRLSILPSYEKPEGEFDMKKSMPGIRSLLVFSENDITLKSKFELVRVLKHHFNRELIYQISEMSNLRWIEPTDIEHSSLFKLWDLQYFIISPNYVGKRDLPLCIWFMPQLRHIEASFRMVMRERDVFLPPLPPKTKNPCVLERLQVLYGIRNFRCDDEVLERIPNLKKLKIFNFEDEHIDWSYYLLNNLANMSKLETLYSELHCTSKNILVGNILFPVSLKKLTLLGSKISWEHMDQIIGVLPNLVILRLFRDAFVGSKWETSEDHFKKLEYLGIQDCHDLKEWIVEDSNHFPSLRLIFIKSCEELEGIPICIGEIPTLEAIELVYCSKGVCSSGKTIQDDFNNDIKLIIGEKTRYAYEEDDSDNDQENDTDNDQEDDGYEYEDEDDDDNEDDE